MAVSTATDRLRTKWHVKPAIEHMVNPLATHVVLAVGVEGFVDRKDLRRVDVHVLAEVGVLLQIGTAPEPLLIAPTAFGCGSSHRSRPTHSPGLGVHENQAVSR